MPRRYTKPTPRTLTPVGLSERERRIAASLGNGTLTKGIRRALNYCGHFCRQHDIHDCPLCGKAGSHAAEPSESAPVVSEFD